MKVRGGSSPPARTNLDRSNVGVLTEFQRLLAFDLSDPLELPLLDLSLRLATFPVHATCKLFGVEPSRRDWRQQ
jgi:hypothetical protein